MRSYFFWDFTQRELVVTYRWYGTTYPSHLKGSSGPRNYQSTLRKILKDRRRKPEIIYLIYCLAELQTAYIEDRTALHIYHAVVLLSLSITQSYCSSYLSRNHTAVLIYHAIILLFLSITQSYCPSYLSRNRTAVLIYHAH